MSFKMLEGFKAKPLSQSMAELDKIWAFIGEDGGPMIPIKTKEAMDLAKTATEQRKKGKCLNPVVKVGTENGNLLFRIEADNDYLESTILTKGYEALKAERAKTTVVNAQQGNKVIDDSSDRMAKAKGTQAEGADTVDLNEKGDNAPICILAHGRKAGNSPGKIFADEFAKKTPEQIVKYIVDKKLSKNYAGVIYLDGCFTAAGPKQGADEGELTNFAKAVYKGLVKEGYEYLQVKGNLGASRTLADGTERVADAQVDEEAQEKHRKDCLARAAKLKERYELLDAKAKDITGRVDKLSKVSQALVARHKGNAEALAADPGIKLVKDEVDRLEGERGVASKAIAAVRKESSDLVDEFKKIGERTEMPDSGRINNLVGVFGPEKLATQPWYKQLFG